MSRTGCHSRARAHSPLLGPSQVHPKDDSGRRDAYLPFLWELPSKNPTRTSPDGCFRPPPNSRIHLLSRAPLPLPYTPFSLRSTSSTPVLILPIFLPFSLFSLLRFPRASFRSRLLSSPVFFPTCFPSPAPSAVFPTLPSSRMRLHFFLPLLFVFFSPTLSSSLFLSFVKYRFARGLCPSSLFRRPWFVCCPRYLPIALLLPYTLESLEKGKSGDKKKSGLQERLLLVHVAEGGHSFHFPE